MADARAGRAEHAFGLCTDLYEIRMAASYLRRGMTAPATFSLFARRLPLNRGFLVASGLESALDLLSCFAFGPEDLRYLRDGVGLPAADVRALSSLRFEGDVLAVPEGHVVLADEPLLEVTAPLPQAQLVETLLLNQLTFATAVASKAARCRLAAPHATLVDFSARRTHGLEAALAVARASAIVGFDGTSYVQAARQLGLTPMGTMAHSYVQAFPDETIAFRAFAQDFPRETVFLVDTYDTTAGVEHAVAVVLELGLDPARVAVRLDSGDLAQQARLARGLLDRAGMTAARIMASGGLDELTLADLVKGGAPIDAYGVGTAMGVSADAPSLDTAYKLVAYEGRPVMKLSSGKSTAPGAKQVYRSRSGLGDVLALRDDAAPHGTDPLLVPVMRDGRRTGHDDEIALARARFEHDLERLPRRARALRDPEAPVATRSVALRTLTDEVSRRLDQRAGRKT